MLKIPRNLILLFSLSIIISLSSCLILIEKTPYLPDTDTQRESNEIVKNPQSSYILDWEPNGTAICNENDEQSKPQIVSDGAGGAIITWHDFRSGSHWDIYAQRINAAGIILWKENGTVICDADDDQVFPKLAEDGTGGAIIMWEDFRRTEKYGDIYAQKVNEKGEPQWSKNGVLICNTNNTRIEPQLIGDREGGAIIAWSESSGSHYDIYAQKINATGIPQWTENGTLICDADGDQYYPQLVSDGKGGAIITWYDYRNGVNNIDIYAQWINSTGVSRWGDNGKVICDADGNQRYPKLAEDGTGGAIIIWNNEVSNYVYDIYAQRINAAGDLQWSDIIICTKVGNQDFGYDLPQIVSDGTGGAIITWHDERKGLLLSDIYAQQINALGNVQWTTNGSPICNTDLYESMPQLVSDGNGGAIITWNIQISGNNWDIYAQSIKKDKIIKVSNGDDDKGTAKKEVLQIYGYDIFFIFSIFSVITLILGKKLYKFSKNCLN